MRSALGASSHVGRQWADGWLGSWLGVRDAKRVGAGPGVPGKIVGQTSHFTLNVGLETNGGAHEITAYFTLSPLLCAVGKASIF